MKFAIIGAGAIGIYYGGLLARSGKDIHFLLHSDYEHVKKNGLKIESCDGDYSLPIVSAYSAPTEMPICDAAIVSLKTTQNKQLLSILPFLLKKTGIIVLLQNGLGLEKGISSIMPECIILSGICQIASNKIGHGHIRHQNYGKITLAEYRPDYKPAGLTKTLLDISDTFRSSGITIEAAENLGLIRWKKLVWNIPFNGISSILNATTSELMSDASSKILVKDTMLEVITAANKCGFSLDRKLADQMLEHTQGLAPYKTSMLLDYESKRQPELEAILENPVTSAKYNGFDMVLTRTFLSLLRFKAKVLMPN